MVSPDRLAVAMMERLSPPDSKASIIASERMPSSGIWKAIDCSVLTEKNRSPIMIANATQSASNSRVRVATVPLPARPTMRRRSERAGALLIGARSGFAALAATRRLLRPK
ncbi:hypothetical protein ACVWYI_002264 [Bradyrhizobium sp. LB13.1]